MEWSYPALALIRSDLVGQSLMTRAVLVDPATGVDGSAVKETDTKAKVVEQGSQRSPIFQFLESLGSYEWNSF